MRLIKKILFIVLFTNYALISAQQTLPQITWFDNDPRLKLKDEVSDVKVDSEGNVWIITFSEIKRYNGKDYHSIYTKGINHSSFQKFGETPSKRKFVYDFNGLIYFIESDTLIAYKQNSLIAELPKGSYIYDIYFDSLDYLHYSYIHGTFEIRGDTLIPKRTDSLEKEPHFSFKLESPKPVLIKGSVNEKYWTKKSWKRLMLVVDSNNTLLKKIPLPAYEYVNYPSIATTKQNEHFFSTGLGQLFFISKDGEVDSIPFKYPIINLFIDSKENLWISTRNEGIHFIPNSDFSKEGSYTINIKGTTIISAEDKEGGIWGYRENRGFFRINRPNIFYANKQSFPGLNNHIVSSSIGKDGIYLGFTNKLVLIDHVSGLITPIPLPENNLNINPDETPYSIRYDQDSEKLLISQKGLLSFLENDKWISLKSNFKKRLLNKLSLGETFYSKNIKLCAINERWYFLWNQKNQEVAQTNLELNYPNDFLKEIKVIGDSIFLLGTNSLYLEFKGNKHNYKDQFPQLENEIYDWHYFQKELWITTKTKGVFILRQDSLISVNYGVERINNARLTSQTSNSLWLFSDQGSFNYETKRSDNEREYQLSAYRALPNSEFTKISSDSQMCFIGTSAEGLMIVRFDNLKKAPRTAPIINFKKLQLGNRLFELDCNLVVSHKENLLQVNFNGVSYDNENINYRYRLLGLDSSWLTTKDRTIQFTNLTAGSYQFEINARKGENMWNNASSNSFSFKINPPFWKTGWFIFLVSFSILLLAYYIISFRIKIANKEKTLTIHRLNAEQKALRSKMDPHFVFNIISSIQYYLLKNENKKAMSFLEQVSMLIRKTLHQTEKEFVSLEEEILFLKEYIELEKLRLPNRFHYSIDLDVSASDNTPKIPTLIIQPFVENAIHHGLKNKEGKGQLNIIFSRDKDILNVQIKDNGVGFSINSQLKKDKEKRFGINIIKERLKLYNKDNSINAIEILSKPGNGTLVRIKIRIKS